MSLLSEIYILEILSLSKLSPKKTLTHPPPPLMTIGGHHELSLYVVRPLHGEERFNRSKILRIHPRDSIANEALDPFFHSFFEVTLTSMSFS